MKVLRLLSLLLGKANIYGRPEYGYIRHHINPLKCGVAALSLSYLFRFDIAKQEIDWNDATGNLGKHLLVYSPTKGHKAKLSKGAHYQRGICMKFILAKKLKDDNNITSSKATHMGRKLARITMSQADVSKDQKDKLGRWINEAGVGEISYDDIPYHVAFLLIVGNLCPCWV